MNKRKFHEPIVASIGGSWIANRKLIQHQDWDQIKLNAQEAALIADEKRIE